MNTMNFEDIESLLDELADMSAAEIRDSMTKKADDVHIVHRKSQSGFGHTPPYRHPERHNVWKRTT